MPTKYDLKVTPATDADVPDGDGYYLHKLFTAQTDKPLTSLTVSMLMDGPFRSGEQRHHKRVLGGETYSLHVSVTNDTETDALDDALHQYTTGDAALTLKDTSFTVEDYTRDSYTLPELWEQAKNYAAGGPEVKISFNTPTCVVHPRSTITEMFPHRRSIFPQLAAAWNVALETTETPGELNKFALDPFDVGSNVFEKPQTDTFNTYSTLTDMREDENGDPQPFFRQGYIGTCSYAFRHADENLVAMVVALALFAEYNGVGSETHHGCGNVTTAITASDSQ